MRRWNDDDLRTATRMVSTRECAFGIAWYEGKADGDRWVGSFVGNDGDPEKAEAWLRGEDVAPAINGMSFR